MKDGGKTLKRVQPALEAVKNRDAQAVQAAQALVAAVDAERAAIEAGVADAAASLDPTDLAASAAFAQWRMAQMRRLERLAERRAGLAQEVDEKRRVLLRSHGQVKAVAHLIETARSDAAERRRRAERRRSDG